MSKRVVIYFTVALMAGLVALAAVGCGSGSSSSDENGTGSAGTGADQSYVITACQANLRTLETAAQTYFASTGNWPHSLNDLVPGYVRVQSLQCPAGGNYVFRVSNNQVVITCPNGHKL